MMSEALGFERGVSRSWSEAPIFMGMLTGLIVLGAVIALIPGLPLIPVLVGVYVLNGLLLPVELFAILRLINEPRADGRARQRADLQRPRLGHRDRGQPAVADADRDAGGGVVPVGPAPLITPSGTSQTLSATVMLYFWWFLRRKNS